ncbi:MAG: nucleotidyltransferase domain-containing protein [Chitinophagaceae bacterium]|nr:nucleotidyltransferase domain-containing protein [Chitinophagaceae bacterium]
MSSENHLRQLIRQAVLDVDPSAEMYLFGSRARGDADKFSDWDVLILSSMQVDEKVKDLFRDKILEVEIAQDQIITSIIYSKLNWGNYSVTPLFQNIQKEGVQL